MRVVVLLVALAACDRVLGITTLPDDGARNDGDDTGATGDVPSADCDLANFAAHPATLGDGVSQVTVAPDKSFAVVLVNGTMYVQTPAETGARKQIATLSGTQWSYPSAAPNGKELYVANGITTHVYSLLLQGQTWGGPTEVPTITSTSLPGAFGTSPAGERRIMVKEGTEFREYAEFTPGQWTPATQTRSLKALTDLDAGTISDPSLSADASTLMFVVSGTGPVARDGIWYSKRTDYELGNNFATTTSLAWGRVIPGDQITMATPQLVGCSIYASTNFQLVRYDP